MSVYSVDSLENINERSRICGSSKEVTICNNLKMNGDSHNCRSNSGFYFTPDSTLSDWSTGKANVIYDTRSNETTRRTRTDRNTRTLASRNAIIANGGIADVSKRRRSSSTRNGKQERVPQALTNKRNVRQEGRSVNKRFECTERSPKTLPSRGSQHPARSSVDPKTPIKAEKNISTLAPKIQQQTKSHSYAQNYHRELSVPRYRIQSPEGSTLSICGDTEPVNLTEDNDIGLHDTTRDDRTEFSFYRRRIGRSVDRVLRTTRSFETVNQRHSKDPTKPRSPCKAQGNEVNGKSKKKRNYRPYTIDEYRNLTVPKLDRSLGPDKVEIQIKGEWLMRRRSYGNSVSQRNRQQILLQSRKFKLRSGAGEKCFLPPLKDQEVDAKIRGKLIISKGHGNENNKGDHLDYSSGYFKKNADSVGVSTSKMLKKFTRTPSFSSSLNSYDVVKDSYLDSLKQRHFYERETLSRTLSQAVCY